MRARFNGATTSEQAEIPRRPSLAAHRRASGRRPGESCFFYIAPLEALLAPAPAGAYRTHFRPPARPLAPGSWKGEIGRGSRAPS